jgi:23S rRNA pseudouridine2605 synthase
MKSSDSRKPTSTEDVGKMDTTKSRKARIPKQGWKPPSFDAFQEVDKKFGRTYKDRPQPGAVPKPRKSDKPYPPRPAEGRGLADKPGFKPKPRFNRDSGIVEGEQTPSTYRGPSRKPFGPGRASSDRGVFKKRSFGESGTPSDEDKHLKTGKKSFRNNLRGFGPLGQGRRNGLPSASTPEIEEVRLNKFIAHSGVCARREADALITAGKVSVNGTVVTALGSKVKTSDKVTVDGATIRFEPFKYILMHKPKNTITTTSDEKGRKTVMDLIENEIGERVYPIGRLDRNTTGVLLLTNDGDLANRLMHPSYSIGKVYQAEINRILTDQELKQLLQGVELEDGMAKAYQVSRVEIDPYTIQLSVQEGRNHLVKRMIEALGAEVVKLKRNQFAGLNLDDLRPGRWRFLKTKEINTLRTKVKLPEIKLD